MKIQTVRCKDYEFTKRDRRRKAKILFAILGAVFMFSVLCCSLLKQEQPFPDPKVRIEVDHTTLSDLDPLFPILPGGDFKDSVK